MALNNLVQKRSTHTTKPEISTEEKLAIKEDKSLAKRVKHALFQSSAIILFLAAWEISARLELFVSQMFLPPFSRIVYAIFQMTLDGELFGHLFISLQRSLLGFICGMLFAIPLGLAVGWFEKLGRFLSPLLQVFRNMPTLALLPVFVIFLGIGELSKVTVIFWGVLWAVLLNTIAGVQSVDPQLIKASRSMGAGSLRLFATVVFPASLPFIFTGIRISATHSVLILIAAEMIGAKKGLGYAIFHYQANMKPPEMFAYIIVLAIFGVALNFILEVAERRNFRWRDEGRVVA